MKTSLDGHIHALRGHMRRNGIRAVLLGLSGGADSVMAFHLLRLAGEGIPGFRLGAVHVNFMLRGEESMRDEEFARALTAMYAGAGEGPEVSLTVERFDTRGYCAGRHVSVEMGARELRHGLFRRLAAEGAYDRIATGHNAGDNEETLLLNLLRGSGSRGLRGMDYDNGRILRPLLRLPRTEIMRLLDAVPRPQSSGAALPSHITDSSNLTDDYSRNFLRHQVIPLLHQRFPGVHTSLQSTLRIQAEESKIVEASLRDALAEVTDTLSWQLLQTYPSPSTLILKWLEPHGCTPAIALEMASHIPPSGQPCATTGRRWQFPDGSPTEVYTSPAGLRLVYPRTLHPVTDTQSIPADGRPVLPGDYKTDELLLSPEVMEAIRHCPPGEAYLPEPPEAYCWSTPSPGQRMTISRRGATKLISDILREAGVPASLRASVPLLIHRASGIPVWLPGIRRAMTSLISRSSSTAWHWHP